MKCSLNSLPRPQDPMGVPPGRGWSCGVGVGGERRGAAAVEFALVFPIMLSVMMGILETGRAFMVLDMLNDTARQGARVGAVAGRSNSQITTTVDNALSTAGLPSRASGTTLAILVDNASVDASTAASDAQI